jgi:hypothetical protein
MGGLADAGKALREGKSGAALRVEETVVLPQPGDRWKPLPAGAGLELVDKQGRSRGWVYVRRALLEAEEGG